MIILTIALSFSNLTNVSAAAKAPKFGTTKTISVKVPKSKIESNYKLATIINKLTNNKALDAGFAAAIGSLAKSSMKSAGMVGFAAGATSMGMTSLSKSKKKDLATKLKVVKDKKAKGIIIKTTYKYHKSFDIGEGGNKGYWVIDSQPTYKTY